MNNYPMQVQVLPHAEDFSIEEISKGGLRNTYDVMPVFDHQEDSGRRLYVVDKEVILHPFVPTVVRHGIAVKPRKGYETQIRPRSSSRLKRNISVELGTIDRGFSGEISSVVTYMPQPVWVTVQDHGGHDADIDNYERILAFDPKPLILKYGERVSQLVEVAVLNDGSIPHRVLELTATSRGGNGWGSTTQVPVDSKQTVTF